MSIDYPTFFGVCRKCKNAWLTAKVMPKCPDCKIHLQAVTILNNEKELEYHKQKAMDKVREWVAIDKRASKKPQKPREP